MCGMMSDAVSCAGNVTVRCEILLIGGAEIWNV